MTIRPDIDDATLDAALAWQQALAADEVDWDGYTAWLEADPCHRIAFDEIALIDRAVDEHATTWRAPPAADLSRTSGRAPRMLRRYWIGGSVAAALAAAVAIPVWQRPAADMIYTTGANQTRHVALRNGTVIDLAPQTRLVVEKGDADRLQLASGEAFFDVQHDPSRTLGITVGGYTVSDIGTRFGISVGGGYVRVAVADGRVAVAPDGGEGTSVAGGQQLVAERNGQNGHIIPVTSTDVGAWRTGRLVYNQAPLGIVAADLERHLQRTVVVDPTVRTRSFSGVLSIANGPRTLQDLADLMDLDVSTTGKTVRLSAARHR